MESLYTLEKSRLAALQQELSERVMIPEQDGYSPSKGDLVLALDIQYEGDWAHVGGDLFSWRKSSLGTFAGLAFSDVPYVPGYFCFREGPPLLSFLARLAQESLPRPELLVIDGHGIAHPRRFGVACWVGLATGIPTIGCAKDTLLRYEGKAEDRRGSKREVLLGEEVVGYVLRTQHKIKPVFVSPGHLISLEKAVEAVLGFPGRYRLPDPLRHADHAARAHCKGVIESSWQDLGELPPIDPPW